MERNLERFYLKFKRPPFAPTYYPTEEEFLDPIAYVAKVKADGEKFGIIKIVPPESFRPPFVIDPSKFEFTPRVQKLNEIDAFFRVRIIFINKLVNFWHLQGQQFRLPWVENKYIDLYQLQKLVAEYGGLEKVNIDRKWTVIAKLLGFKSSSSANLKQNYTRWIHPYVRSIEKLDNTGNDNVHIASTSGIKEEVGKCENSNELSMQGQNLRRSTRMMAGVKQKPDLPSLDKSSLPIEMVYCANCNGGGDEDRLLLCETCDRSLHTYCLDPPLSAVPKGDWRCPQCVANVVKTVSFEFGFLDSNMKFNLDTFGEWANNFKESYFNQAPCDVSAEDVENEFWRNIVNIDKDVSVKYGADLITSKMGSGFPRKTDMFKGVDAKERNYYANHPWNLNNLPILRESVLSYINTDISGMMVPWVYVGMCFSTFCWHVEDHWTYSINYNHWGERKIWYGLAGDDAEKFDDFFRKNVPELFQGQMDLLHHMTTALNPSLLIDFGIPVYTVHQNPGEFVITFPRAYHSGYNEGLNFAEAVNFAPPDWLRMGRFCLNNYASVRRTCVFSHEELVMQMVKIADRMSIQMCLSTLEELRYIITRETEFRKRLTQSGLHESEFRQFENIPDDERSCHICRTTLYVSALVCKHRKLVSTSVEGKTITNATVTRIVCMDHIDQLCEKCPISDCSLIYRYSMEDFVPLAEKLAQRTNAFEEWRDKINEFKKKDGAKISVHLIRSLMETWKSKRYPHCSEIVDIMDSLSRFDKLTNSVNKIINRKIRLRENTRCQKADNRYKFEELQCFWRELSEFWIQDEVLENSLKELCDRVTKWREKVCDLLDLLASDNYHGVQAVDTILKLIYEGEEFNLKLSEMAVLSRELTYCQWILRATQIIEWRKRHCSNISPTSTNSFGRRGNSVCLRRSHSKSSNEIKDTDIISKINVESANRFCDNKTVVKEDKTIVDANSEYVDDESEEEEKYSEITRFTMSVLTKIVTEGEKLDVLCESKSLIKSYLKQLAQMQNDGLENEKKAADFLKVAEGVGFAQAEKRWLDDLHRTDWLDATAMNTFRNELESALTLNRQFVEQIEGADEHHNFSLKVIESLEAQCERALFERNGHLHVQIQEIAAQLRKFVERIAAMFQKSVGYYNIFEIISGRDDLTALVEGDSLPRTLLKSLKYGENWTQLKHYYTSSLLTAHLVAISEQQLNLLMALRLVNARRSVNETCVCGGYSTTMHCLNKRTGHNSKRSSLFNDSNSKFYNHSNNINNNMAGELTSNNTYNIFCFLCHAVFHELCAQWEPFLGRLPAGIFLCVRCLRGRRPCVEDVEAACEAAPPNSLERLLVANLVKRASEAFYCLQKSMHQISSFSDFSAISTQQIESVKQSLIMALSLEVMDVEAYKTAFSNPHFSALFPVNETQLFVWQRIQSRMVEALPRRIIFPPPMALSAGNGGGSTKRVNSKRNSAGTLLNKSSGSNLAASGSQPKLETTLIEASSSTSFPKSNDCFNDGEMEVLKKQIVTNNSEERLDGDASSVVHNNSNIMNKNTGELFSAGGKKKCRDSIYKHADQEFCAADKCLRPYSDQVRWIQCESGCMRWYHYVCVGQTVKAAQKICTYTCYRCASDFADLHITP